MPASNSEARKRHEEGRRLADPHHPHPRRPVPHRGDVTGPDIHRIQPEAIVDARPVIRELAIEWAEDVATTGGHANLLHVIDVLTHRLALEGQDPEDAVISARRDYFHGLNLWEPDGEPGK